MITRYVVSFHHWLTVSLTSSSGIISRNVVTLIEPLAGVIRSILLFVDQSNGQPAIDRNCHLYTKYFFLLFLSLGLRRFILWLSRAIMIACTKVMLASLGFFSLRGPWHVLYRAEYFVTWPFWSKLSAEKNNFKIGPETKKLSVPYVVNFWPLAKKFTPACVVKLAL